MEYKAKKLLKHFFRNKLWRYLVKDELCWLGQYRSIFKDSDPQENKELLKPLLKKFDSEKTALFNELYISTQLKKRNFAKGVQTMDNALGS